MPCVTFNTSFAFSTVGSAFFPFFHTLHVVSSCLLLYRFYVNLGGQVEMSLKNKNMILCMILNY